ncbi:MAG: biotin carboxylase N-terminal domain-containing protein, partial [Longimicrobiales bacterium]
MIRKVLVANRGEIAVRIIRACRELGITSVAVFSDADRLASHVLAADEAYPIGPAPSAQSYLVAERLVDVARAAGCDAVHPGYGFLAERAFFAEAVEAAGLVFVGPPASAIAAMGDKTEARRRMMAAGVPVVPGNAEPLADAVAATDAAAKLGYPVLLKAAAGGGGKGMRVVQSAAEVERAFAAASSEAKAAFGDGSVYVEKYLAAPRHIEIQVLADAHGRVLHLNERECSIQRRHQKMVEEAPSPAVTPEMRERMGAAAVAAAEAVCYRNAGTIEFLVQEGEFYFLEMNTRIQVE